MLDPVSPVPAVAALAVALLTAHLLGRSFGVPSGSGRFVPIDGLRGYLAFFVFLHHSCIWYYYLRSGVWQLPPSNLYTHFGQSGVAFFFMITAFLFTTKLIDGRHGGVDWTRLYVSRLLRLTPLYLLAMLLLFIVVGVLSHGALHVALPKLAGGMARWLCFTMLGGPELNGVKDTSLILADVTWSLPYEWLFYCALPLLALLTGNVAAWPFLGLGVLAALGFVLIYGQPPHLAAFAAGMAAALLVRHENFRRLARRRPSGALAALCILTSFLLFPTEYAAAPLLLSFLAFALIAGGNTLFGALRQPLSLVLGEMSYSLYLLHGLMLFLLFRFVIGMERAAQLSAAGHWLCILLLAPLLVVVCFLSFRLVELPPMRRSQALSDRISALLWRRSSAAAGG